MSRPIGRRAFLRLAGAAGLVHAGAALPLSGYGGGDGLRILALLPPGDPALAGVRLGGSEAEHAARLFRTGFALREAPAAAADDAAVLERLVAEHRPHAVIGGATPSAADGLMRLASERDLLFLNVGVPLEALRQRCDARTFHFRPSNAMRLAALAAAAPASGDSADRARAVSWHPTLSRFGAAQVIDRYETAFGEPMMEGAWEGWLAVKVLFDASQRARTTEAAGLAQFLVSPRAAFDGHKGIQLSFRADTRQLRQPLYIVVGNRVLEEVPSARALGSRTHAELLDTIIPPAGSACVHP
jgi:ABC-type branched-subunit amino acid transport system substrate-binding protein